MDANESFSRAHTNYLRACQEANQAREDVRQLAINRACAVFTGEPASTMALTDAGDALREAEQAEAAAYREMWRIANGQES